MSAPTASEADPMLTEKVAEQQQNEPSTETARHAQTAVTGLVPSGASPAQLAAATDKMVDETVKLDDFYQLGRYTYVVCLLAELLILAQVGNMLYMTYAGAAPTLLKCGQHVFPDAEKANKRCEALADIAKSNQANCTGQNAEWAIQFRSVNVEFDMHCGTKECPELPIGG
ncbi:hypothetical protein niasHS_009210 [Heterodera schachtii]|uniref:Uncharacterized protein n=1 Tax=Heterodera schachtii TaxID=97005 RepID=A0ABD2J0S7_HETSC